MARKNFSLRLGLLVALWAFAHSSFAVTDWQNYYFGKLRDAGQAAINRYSVLDPMPQAQSTKSGFGSPAPVQQMLMPQQPPAPLQALPAPPPPAPTPQPTTPAAPAPEITTPAINPYQ